MDIATLIGLVVAFALMVIAIGFSAIGNFIDLPSAQITFGGALMCMLAQSSIPDFIGGLKSVTLAIKKPNFNIQEMIGSIINLSNVARKEGLLSLEEAAGNIDDAFLKKGIMLVVDGTDPELVRAIMETEMDAIEGRHKSNSGFWEDLGAMGPAWGMIGTLIGLVNMLKNLSDSAAIGPAMAVALLTTFYGSVLSNWICTPVSKKLQSKNGDEMAIKGIQVEGLLSIQAGENPRVIEEKLKSYLSPKDAAGVSSEGGDEGGGG